MKEKFEEHYKRKNNVKFLQDELSGSFFVCSMQIGWESERVSFGEMHRTSFKEELVKSY